MGTETKQQEEIPDEHKIQCAACKQYFDARDLSQVFYHETDCLNMDAPKPVQFSSSRKLGEPAQHLNDENKTKIDLN